MIKPLPENEASVRPTLRKAGETARSKGATYDSTTGNQTKAGGCYYSFYSYTKPDVAVGFTAPAGAEAGWAKGLSPAVCSAFIWLCMKENGVSLVTKTPYETLSDFTQLAIASGAEVGPSTLPTLDGLIFYPAAERLSGALALRSLFMNQALSKEGGFGNLFWINDTYAGPIADQLLNMFAFGDPTLVGSSKWQEPGDANAVSPDNIIWWNPPYFGYAEPLQYCPQHTEQYTTSVWKKVISYGNITGTVHANGAAVANAHVWVYQPGGDTYTDANGNFDLSHIPTGTYTLSASAVIGNIMYTANTPIALTTTNPNLTVAMTLKPPIESYRRIDFSYSVSCDHSDGNPFNTHGVEAAGPYSHSLYINPGQEQDGYTFPYDYNGGGYFHVDYTFTADLLPDNSIALTIVGAMYDDGSGNKLVEDTFGPVTVVMGETLSGVMTLKQWQTGYTNGPAVFSFKATNNQQTG